MKLIKPERLKPGDTVASVSLSWGGAGDPEINWRYLLGKKRLEDIFGLKVVEMSTTLKGSEYVYSHPEERAKDLMDAFKDPEIRGIFSCIGGDDSIRMLPYIDYESIRENPKVFIGYSDTTITHLICHKAGISSFYGASILAEMAENVEMHQYTVDWIKKCIFENDVIGRIKHSQLWTSERLPWEEGNKDIKRKLLPNNGYELLQGEGTVVGRLLGGCVEVLEMAKGTEVWPDLETFNSSILFLETSEDMPSPENLLYALRNYGAQGILKRINGMIFGKPYHNKYYDEYKEVIIKALKEYSLESLPVLYNLSFGHTSPMIVLPYGALAEIDCTQSTFSILEAGVI
ncbi:LD-carboxypeptidase [Gudongella oleilytica]|uniref:S66 family peptidase n=1 Tax=Gudongella oleilytica TaxID=1582259 RepID=UPI002A359941|nr:LD-carboxypeptidase [Gudongella oleilytica]MDY0256051.1 LD-carboxypeptidase [Gudongella oleilytica]